MEKTATSLGHPVYDHKTNSIWHLSQNDVQPLVKYLMTIITKLLLLTYVSYAPVNLCPAKWSKFFCVFKICYVHHVCCLNQQLLRNNNHKWHYKVSFVKLYWFSHWYTHTHTCLTALCPGLPGWAGTRGKTNLDFTEANRRWVVVASAGLYATLHLAPDR